MTALKCHQNLTGGLIIKALLLVMALPVYAADTQTAEKWQFGGEVYLWSAYVNVKPVRADDIDISFSEIKVNGREIDDFNLYGPYTGVKFRV